MSIGVKLVAAFFGLCVVVLTGLIVRSSFEMSLAAGLRDVVGTWWGITTMFDLYVGLILVAIWICAVERRVWPSAGWILGLMLLGNFAAALYVLNRARRARTVAEIFMPTPPASAGRS